MPNPPPDEKAKAAVVLVYGRLRARVQGRFSVQKMLICTTKPITGEFVMYTPNTITATLVRPSTVQVPEEQLQSVVHVTTCVIVNTGLRISVICSRDDEDDGSQRLCADCPFQAAWQVLPEFIYRRRMQVIE